MGLFWKKKAAAGNVTLAPPLPGLPEFPQYPSGSGAHEEALQPAANANQQTRMGAGQNVVSYEPTFQPKDRPRVEPAQPVDAALSQPSRAVEVPALSLPSFAPPPPPIPQRNNEGFMIRPQPQFRFEQGGGQQSAEQFTPPAASVVEQQLPRSQQSAQVQQAQQPGDVFAMSSFRDALQAALANAQRPAYQSMMQQPPRASPDVGRMPSMAQPAGTLLAGREELAPGEQPVFVKLDRYREAMDSLQILKQQMREVETVLSRLDEIRKREENELQAYRAHLGMLKERLLDIDKKLFDV